MPSKIIYSFLILLSPLFSSAQPSIVKSYRFDNGFTIKVDDEITLGNPTKGNEYLHIFKYQGVWGTRETFSKTDEKHYKIERLLKYGEGKYITLHAYIKINSDKYVIDVVKAIENQEILVEEKYREGLFYEFELSDLSIKDGKVFYEQIIDLGHQYDKNAIYNAAKQTFIKVFKDAQEVIQYENIAEGEIIGKGFSKSYFKFIGGLPQGYKIWFLCKISAKDGKYRIQLYDQTAYLYYDLQDHFFDIYDQINNYKNGTKSKKRHAKEFLTSLHIENTSLINSIIITMQETIQENQNDDW